MIARFEARLRRVRRWLSRSGWMIRLLGLSTFEGAESEPGLVMIQVDGLGREALNAALARNEMPFLKRLLVREGHELHRFYSGLPASTPAVQAELFYGVKTAVPAFSFRQRGTGEIVRMYQPAAAADIEARLAAAGEGLLKDGSAYADIFTGGAAETHYCPSSLGWGEVLRSANPALIVLFVLMNFFSLLRTAALLIIESILAVVDFVRGLIAGHDLIKEIKFVPTRVMISIGLRELVTIGAKIDVARGLPIVHVNFLGYDEQAHRRGPDSRFAHWTLKGIDRAIRRLHRAARHSPRRDYDVWIYSDHGQVRPETYSKRFGVSIDSAVAEVLARPLSADQAVERGEQSQRVRFLGGKRVQKFFPAYAEQTAVAPPRVAALGTIAHVYCAQGPDRRERQRIAKSLVAAAGIPMVLIVADDGSVCAFTSQGEFLLPRDRHRLLGENHPFVDAAANDLVAVARHEEAGDFVLCGWRDGTSTLTFAEENGSHTGANPSEVDAFALLPSDVLPGPLRGDFIRPLDLREAVLYHQKRHVKLPWIARHRSAPGDTLRIMSYNVHSCVGMDGRISPSRIARVIARQSPDIVALQELDEGRVRTAGIDQARQIARLMEMDHHFHPAIHIEEERYGDAILTHLPMQLVKAGTLPRPAFPKNVEPRGALWASIELPDGSTLQVINTHLGLSRAERLAQVDALLGEEWLGHADCRGPLILCGDLNALPGSPVCRRLARRLHDAQNLLDAHRPKSTFFTHLPAFRIDHVFVSDEVEVVDVQVVRSAMTRIASDHLPLLIEVRFRGR